MPLPTAARQRWLSHLYVASFSTSSFVILFECQPAAPARSPVAERYPDHVGKATYSNSRCRSASNGMNLCTHHDLPRRDTLVRCPNPRSPYGRWAVTAKHRAAGFGDSEKGTQGMRLKISESSVRESSWSFAECRIESLELWFHCHFAARVCTDYFVGAGR
jgi:hypothetical protein